MFKCCVLNDTECYLVLSLQNTYCKLLSSKCFVQADMSALRLQNDNLEQICRVVGTSIIVRSALLCTGFWWRHHAGQVINFCK